MLVGNNKLDLNNATMQAAVEEYLNERIKFSKDYVSVTHVKYRAADHCFEVSVRSASEDGNDSAG